ncbi:MAG: dockerin type I repeat-containing protein [Ruminococcus sp.]|nr:dockerin type I repeat-containing protein [Ruminococcus sp.]
MKKHFMATVSLLLIGVLSLGSVISVSAKALPLYGDVNADSIISVDDTTEIQKHLSNISEFSQEELTLADYNGDGKVDILDVTDIQKMLASLDYKYAHELYEVENVDFSSEELTSLEFKVDKCIRPYFNISYDYLYNGTCNSHLRTTFKTYDEYSRFFKSTFDEYDEKFFEDNALIFMYDHYYSDSIKDNLDNVYVKDNVLYLELTHREPAEGEPVTEGLGFWNQFIVVDKASVENVDKIRVKSNLDYFYW